MSTTSSIGFSADPAYSGALVFERAVDVEPLEGTAPLESENFRISSPSLRPDHKIKRATRKVLRRLRGFLVEERDEEARVVLENGGKRFDYYLPTHNLRSAGITQENQPFEMDEYEEKNDDGSFSTGYTFRPLAKDSDAFTDTVDLDDERKRKRDLILKKFKDAAH